jgi:hypothetical protein
MAGENEVVALEDFTGLANRSQPTKGPLPGRVLNLSHCLTVACLLLYNILSQKHFLLRTIHPDKKNLLSAYYKLCEAEITIV